MTNEKAKKVGEVASAGLVRVAAQRKRYESMPILPITTSL